MRGTAAERFWAKVNKTETCWLWTANTVRNRRGVPYGLFTRATRKAVTAHRYSYEMAIGPIPDGVIICHHCDTPLCVRPDHLFAGTQGDNMRDAVAKGRIDFARLQAASLATRAHTPLPLPKTICKRGHSFSGDNLYVSPIGRRICRACNRIHWAKCVAGRQQRESEPQN